MSVDYNELYQEFILLTSSPSSSSSVASSPSDPSTPTDQQQQVKSHLPAQAAPLRNTRKTVLTQLPNMNSIQNPNTPSTPITDHSINSPGVGPPSNSISSPQNIMTPQVQYGWSQHSHHQQQQMQIQSAEKRKDFGGSIPAPPNSPAEPPAKKPAIDSVDYGNDSNHNVDVTSHQQMQEDMSCEMNKQLSGNVGIGSSCIVNNVHAANAANASPQSLVQGGYLDNHAEPDEGTNCVIIQKQPPEQLNELRRLLTAPVGQSPRNHNLSTPQSYGQPNEQYITEYSNQGSGEHMQQHVGDWNQEPMPPDHSHHHHQITMGNEVHDPGQSHPTVMQQHQNQQPIPVQEPMDEVVKFIPWLGSGEPPTFPGGLEVLWREVPEDCQRLITPQDVPETARFRGYFTVCELLSLKRSLVSRLGSLRNGQLPPMRKSPPSVTAVAAAAAAAQAVEIINAGMGVGGVVKEALAVLDEEHQQQQQQQTMSPSVTSISHHPPVSTSNNCAGNTESQHPVNIEHHKDYTVSAPIMKPAITPPPPYRTSTLVFKLLQIGHYRFRSFSEANPNRLKVLFNTQRLSYECHLPMVPSNRDATQLLRKVLTIDVGFDQISHMKFGSDQLYLKVEGAPVLNVAYTPAGHNELPTSPTLSLQDRDLLDQIEKGQLKLSPTHQLYFLNERLVHVLECQFKEHPRFRHLLAQGQGSQGGR